MTKEPPKPSDDLSPHDEASYEEVIVLSAKQAPSTTKKRYRPMRQPPPLHPEDLVMRRKWIAMMTGTGILMLISGSMCGVGVYILMRDPSTNVPTPPSFLSNGTTISAQCRNFLAHSNSNYQRCLYEISAPMKGDSCKSLCMVYNYHVEVKGPRKDIVRLVRENVNISAELTKFKVRPGTSCGDFSCSKNGTCSDQPQIKNRSAEEDNSVSNQLKNEGHWIMTCPDGLEQCVRKDDEDSQGGWNLTVDKSGCDPSKEKVHCTEFEGMVLLVPRFQALRCDVSISPRARILSCNGDPVLVYVCVQCANQLNTSAVDQFVGNACGTGNAMVDECVIKCDGSEISMAMPDGYPCGQSKYCLLGHCYQVSHGEFIDCSPK